MPSPAELKAQGLASFHAEHLDKAAEAFAAAAEAFAAQGDKANAAEMMNNVAVVCLAQKKWALALAAVQGTPEVFRALGDKSREAQALMNLGNAHDNAGNLDEAAKLYEQAIDLFTALGEKENRAACWKALSGLQLKQNKQLQSIASMHAGLGLTQDLRDLSPKEKSLKGMLDKAMKLMGGGK
jgi:tetratricopeptide (TPR) repeat protein